MSRTVMAALIVLLACAAPRASVPLAVEVREYQGEKLGSVTEFRENSIKGPQAVDSAKYRLTVSGLVTRPLTLTLAEVLAYPAVSKVTTLHCVEGWSVKVLW
ncbi:MAG: molybdopterin-dependent oxidoreductase, partial [bacterium]